MVVDTLDDPLVVRYECMPLRVYIVEVYDAVESNDAMSEPRVVYASGPGPFNVEAKVRDVDGALSAWTPTSLDRTGQGQEKKQN